MAWRMEDFSDGEAWSMTNFYAIIGFANIWAKHLKADERMILLGTFEGIRKLVDKFQDCTKEIRDDDWGKPLSEAPELVRECFAEMNAFAENYDYNSFVLWLEQFRDSVGQAQFDVAVGELINNIQGEA